MHWCLCVGKTCLFIQHTCTLSNNFNTVMKLGFSFRYLQSFDFYCKNECICSSHILYCMRAFFCFIKNHILTFLNLMGECLENNVSELTVLWFLLQNISFQSLRYMCFDFYWLTKIDSIGYLLYALMFMCRKTCQFILHVHCSEKKVGM